MLLYAKTSENITRNNDYILGDTNIGVKTLNLNR